MKYGVTFLSIVIFLSAICFSQAAYADELSDLKKRIQEIEKKLEANILVDEESHGVFLRKLDEMFTLNLYISLTFEDFQGTDSLFDAQDLEIISEFNMSDRVNAYFEIEFNGEEAEVEQGWLEYALHETFSPRFGAILIPFGKYNLSHFSFQRELTSRPIVIESIVPSVWAEAGVGFTGNLFTKDTTAHWWGDLNLSYQFFIVNGFREGITRSGTREAKGLFGMDNNNNKALVGRLGIFCFGGQEVGVSGYFGKYDDNNRKDITGLDLDWNFTSGPFTLLGEYAHFDIEGASTPVPKNLGGTYVQVNYSFWFDSLNGTFLGKGYEMPTFTAILRYGRAKIEGDPVMGTNEEKRWTVGWNYRPLETFAVRLEYQFNRSENTPIVYGDRDGLVASVVAAF